MPLISKKRWDAFVKSLHLGEALGCLTLEAQLPIYWVPVLQTLYNFILSVTQGPTKMGTWASRVSIGVLGLGIIRM